MFARFCSPLLLVAVAAGCGRPAVPDSSRSDVLGKAMPSIDRRALDGRKVDPASYAGKTVVVKFFAEYCEPCKRTLPEAEALSRSRTDVVVIGISEDEREDVARGIVEGYGLSFPVVHDRGQVLSGRFRVGSLPATFVVDAQGIVRWAGFGARSQAMAEAVEAIAP
jgi:cytochrome c biogenesis protein CcmG, thiol:disulfide interchange protein DsbE